MQIVHVRFSTQLPTKKEEEDDSEMKLLVVVSLAKMPTLHSLTCCYTARAILVTLQ